MSHDVTMIRAKLHAAFGKIGTTNGQVCPPSSSNHDPIMHELYVAAEGASYFAKRLDRAKQVALEAAMTAEELDGFMTAVTKADAGETKIIDDGVIYQLQLQLSKPARRFDQVAMSNHMHTKLKLSIAQIKAAFEASEKVSAPAKTLKVIPK